jgi:hypothetical protein
MLKVRNMALGSSITQIEDYIIWVNLSTENNMGHGLCITKMVTYGINKRMIWVKKLDIVLITGLMVI